MSPDRFTVCLGSLFDKVDLVIYHLIMIPRIMFVIDHTELIGINAAIYLRQLV